MTDKPRQNRLAEILSQEAFQPAYPSIRPYAEAFGAGAIDPAGLPSWLVNGLIRSPATDWYERRMTEARRQSPIAAGIGSSLIPGVGIGVAGRATAGEIAGMMPYASQFGGSLGALYDLILRTKEPQRPQAAYPGDGF